MEESNKNPIHSMITRWWFQIFYSKRLNTPTRLAPISTNLMNFFQHNSSLIRPDRVPSPPLSTLQRDALRGWGVGEFGRRWGGMRINGQPLNCQEMEVPTTSRMNHPGPKMRTWAAFGRRLVQVMGVFFNWSLVLQFFLEGNGTVVNTITLVLQFIGGWNTSWKKWMPSLNEIVGAH